MTIRSVFITNNGLSDHIGVSQVLPYLERLSDSGHHISCISVEKPSKANVYNEEVRPRLLASQIGHYPITRSAQPLLSKVERFFMEYRLKRKLQEVIVQNSINVIHCRSYMPLGPVLSLSKKIGLPVIFDMRGFWIDERIESGIWRSNQFIWKYVIAHFRRLERKALERSTAIVVLTQDAKDVIAAHPNFGEGRIEVIPCSVNQEVFVPHRHERASQRAKYNIDPDDLVIAYLGSSGPLYCIDVVLKLMVRLKALSCPVRLLFLGEHKIADYMSRASSLGLALEYGDFRSCKVPHHQVPLALSASDFGISLRIPTFSSLGVSATKVGEYLACGLPVITSKGIGDIEKIIEDGKSGVVLKDFGDDEIDRAAKMIAARKFSEMGQIRDKAKVIFDLDQASRQYDGLYKYLGELEEKGSR
jgi:glycosyltransferase involved in cell wall biosynthesis